jgi:hypothetical protein
MMRLRRFLDEKSPTVKAGEDYVVAREYVLEPGFALPAERHATEGVERRVHVGQLRGRLGGHVYELIAREPAS